MKVLIGEISSYKAIVIARYIKIHYPGIFIYGFDYSKTLIKYHTKYIDEFLLINKVNLIDSLTFVINKFNIDIFFPVNNDKLKEFLKSHVLNNTVLNYMGDYSAFNRLNDKKELFKLARNLSINVPTNYSNLISAAIPFVIKPKSESSAKGVIYINSEYQKRKFLNKELSDLVIQEYVQGIGVGLSLYAKNGEILNYYGHKRIAEYPVTGGSSTYRASWFDERMLEIANKLVKEIKYSGFVMFEFKLTNQNKLYLIEANPRIWGSINQGLQEGINYFENILGKLDLKHKKVFTYVPLLLIKSFIGYFCKFNFAPMLFYLKNYSASIPDISFVDDPKGYISTILRKLS